MRITNKLNLPSSIVEAVKNDSYAYSSDPNYISVTTLLKPPRMVALERSHADKLEQDVSNMIHSLFGQSMHGVLERADKDAVTERRLSIEVEGWKVSGAMDRYLDGVLQDYKFVTGWKFKGGGVPVEYEQQLNIYSEILRQNGHPVHKAEIIGFLRDWSKLEARRDPQYPQMGVVMREVPLWTQAKAQAFIRERVILHKQARITLPLCTDEDRWARPTKYAVMREGQVRAVKLFESQAEAEDYAKQGKNLKVETRPGELVRCANYCNVAQFCSQFQKEVKDEVDGRNKPTAVPAGSLRVLK